MILGILFGFFFGTLPLLLFYGWGLYYVIVAVEHRGSIRLLPPNQKWLVFYPALFYVALISTRLLDSLMTAIGVQILIMGMTGVQFIMMGILIGYVILFFFKKKSLKEHAVIYGRLLKPTAIAFTAFAILIPLLGFVAQETMQRLATLMAKG